MEASDSRPAGLRLVRGDGNGSGMESDQSDEDREREVVEEAEAAHRDWLARLPASSSWRKPLLRMWNALAAWVAPLRRRR